jgi:hypothetical protein
VNRLDLLRNGILGAPRQTRGAAHRSLPTLWARTPSVALLSCDASSFIDGGELFGDDGLAQSNSEWK